MQYVVGDCYSHTYTHKSSTKWNWITITWYPTCHYFMIRIGSLLEDWLLRSRHHNEGTGNNRQSNNTLPIIKWLWLPNMETVEEVHCKTLDLDSTRGNNYMYRSNEWCRTCPSGTDMEVWTYKIVRNSLYLRGDDDAGSDGDISPPPLS